MTAVAVYLANNGIVIAADAAMYDPQGIVLDFVPKLRVLDRQRCVVGNTGISTLGAYFSEYASSCADFDDIVDNIVPMARAAYDRSAKKWRDTSDLISPASGTVIVAGMSAARAQFEAYKVHSSGRTVTNVLTGESVEVTPWTAIQLNSFWCSHTPPSDVMAKFGIVAGADLDPAEMCVRWICANRAMSCVDGDDVYGVGGWIDVVALLGDGSILHWQPHSWPDVIGEHINPLRGESLPQMPIVWPTLDEN